MIVIKSIRDTLEQIDVARLLINKYPNVSPPPSQSVTNGYPDAKYFRPSNSP